MSEITENIAFKKDSGEIVEILQKFVSFKARQEGILTVKFRVPTEEIEKIKNFFKTLRTSEPVIYNIGDTGDVKCYFKGIATLLEQKDEAGFPYFFLSVTLQELKTYDTEEPPSCGCS